jgi:hypothetical protein
VTLTHFGLLYAALDRFREAFSYLEKAASIDDKLLGRLLSSLDIDQMLNYSSRYRYRLDIFFLWYVRSFFLWKESRIPPNPQSISLPRSTCCYAAKA